MIEKFFELIMFILAAIGGWHAIDAVLKIKHDITSWRKSFLIFLSCCGVLIILIILVS
jgi:hypothetical protein